MNTSLTTNLAIPLKSHNHIADQVLDPSSLAYLAAENTAIAEDEVYDDFWKPIDFDVVRWDKHFPYQLIIVDVKTDSSGNKHYSQHKTGVFTLPLPPESLVKSMPFAIQTNVTLGGIIENHNGAPLRPIQLRGSTGYLPLRGKFPYSQGFETAQNVTGGFIRSSVNQIAGIVSKVNFSIHSDSEFTSDAPIAKSTGYYQIRKLTDFLEQYANIKKTPKGRDIRLALAIWKDSEVFLVTPQSFVVTKDVSSPLEYRYSLDFVAYKRIDLGPSGNAFQSPNPIRQNANLLARAISTLSLARDIVQQIGNVPQAVLGDIRHVDQIFRQSISFCKDLAGTVQNFNDQPDSIKKAISDACYQDLKSLNEAGKQMAKSASGLKVNVLLGDGLDIVSSLKTNPGRSQVSKKDIQRKILYQNLKEIQIDQFNSILDQKTKTLINNDINKIRQLVRSDFELMRDDLIKFANKMSFLLGAGDTEFADTYGISNIVPIKETPTDSDWELLWALNDSIIELDSLAATSNGEPTEPALLVDSIATLARASGIAFTKPVSKFAVPFPYGSSLESLALQYLGDANRWIEIAALNGLKEPYIDETGFELELLINGLENKILLSYNKNLYVGQKVTVRSNSVTKTVRHITKIDKDLNGNITVTLDGNFDLDRYKTTDTAVLHAYLPDTINSQSLIYIPSEESAIENDYITKAIPGVSEIDPMVVSGGVDLLLDSNKDLILTQDGDSRLSVGLSNIIQNLEIAFGIKQGKLLLHPGFGMPLDIGTSSADVDVRSVVSSIKKMLETDPTFSKVGKITVSKDSSGVSIKASAVVAGSSTYLPISFGLGS